MSTEVLRYGHFFAGEQGFVELLAVTSTDHSYRIVRPQKLPQRQRNGLDGSRRRFLDDRITRCGVLESVYCEVHGVFDGHHEASHRRVGDSEWNSVLDLADKQRDNG